MGEGSVCAHMMLGFLWKPNSWGRDGSEQDQEGLRTCEEEM